MGAADGEAGQPDGHDAVGAFVVFEEGGEGFDFRGGALHVRPAAGAEGAVDALTAGPGIGRDATRAARRRGVVAWTGGAGGVDGEEGVGAAGGDAGDGGGEAGAGVEFLLDGEEGGGVDGGGFRVVVEAELAGGVVAEGEDAAVFVDGETVGVAGGDVGDVEAAQRADFVRLVVRAGGPRGPAEAGDAELAFAGEVGAAGGGGEEPAGGGEEEGVVEAGGDAFNLFGVCEGGRGEDAVADGGRGGVEGDPGAFGGFGAG